MKYMPEASPTDHGNRSLHWTHQFAVLNRVQDPSLDDQIQQKLVSEIQYIELLPDSQVQETLLNNCSVLVSRVVTKYLEPFKRFGNACIYHIKHRYEKEMAEKSNLVTMHIELIINHSKGALLREAHLYQFSIGKH